MSSRIDEDSIRLAFQDYQKGRYRVDELIGEGAMGGVFLAFDTRLHRACAIKVLRAELLDDEHIKGRFMREAVIMTQINHPAVVRVYELDEIDDIPFIILEWVDGGSLWDHIEVRGPMAPQMAVYVMTLVCAGIEAAHAKGIIHRDIKPENVLLAPDGYPKVTDFGIAMTEMGGRMTQMNMGMLSKAYGAPEQASDAARVDVRADVHALGVTLWALLKGNSPPDTWLFGETLSGNPEMLEGIPLELIPIISTATQTRREDRFANVAELREALEGVLETLKSTNRSSTQLYATGETPAVRTDSKQRLPSPVGRRSSIVENTSVDPPAFSSSPKKAKTPAPVAVAPEPDESEASSDAVSDLDLANDEDFAIEMDRIRRQRRIRIAVVVCLLAIAIGVITALAMREEQTEPLSEVTLEQPVQKPEVPAEPIVLPIPEPLPTPRRDERISENAHPRRDTEITAASLDVPVEEPSVEDKPPVDQPKPNPPERKPPTDKRPKPKPPETNDTVVVKAPDPKPMVEEKPIETSRVSVAFPDGDPAKVWLVGPGGRHNIPGSVPSGTYKVIGAFPSGERTAIAALTVSGGRAVRITCNSAFAKCQAR